MNESDIRDLRAELRSDRQELARLIAAGVKELADKMDEHAESDSIQFRNLESRVAVMESGTSTAGKYAYGAIISALGLLMGYFIKG